MRIPATWFTLALLTGACTAPQHDSTDPADSAASITFASPDEAVDALVGCADDPAQADALLGPGGSDLLCASDPEDGEDLAAVREKMVEQVAFADAGDDRKRILLGNEPWELPLQLVRSGDRWRFDVEAGRDELLRRDIGCNELRAIARDRYVYLYLRQTEHSSLMKIKFE